MKHPTGTGSKFSYFAHNLFSCHKTDRIILVNNRKFAQQQPYSLKFKKEHPSVFDANCKR